MNPSVPRAASDPKQLDVRERLTSWKEIAEYMGSGVRTVQRYEREFGLPIRRPTGQSRGSVMATRAEIDAWVAAGPIRETFRLSRVERDSRTRKQTDKIEDGIAAMRKLKDQMQALRLETRSALNLLIDRVSAFHLLMPPARPGGYEPLVNMGSDADFDLDKSLYATDSKQGKPGRRAHRNKRSRRQGYDAGLSSLSKPH